MKKVEVERGRRDAIIVAHEAQPLKVFSPQPIYLNSLEVGTLEVGGREPTYVLA